MFPIELIRNQQSTAADYFAVALHHFGDIRFNCAHKLILTHFLVNAYIPLSHLWIPSLGHSQTQRPVHTVEEEHGIQTDLFVYTRFHSRNIYSK